MIDFLLGFAIKERKAQQMALCKVSHYVKISAYPLIADRWLNSNYKLLEK